jgi:integrase
MARRRSRGEGSLYYWEEKKLWVAKFTLPNGKRKTKYSKTQKEAREWLQNSLNQLRQGVFIADDKVTVSQFFERYMNDFAKYSLKPSTYHNYEMMIRLYINPDIGNIRLTQLRVDNLHFLYAKRRSEGLSDRMVQYVHGILHRTLNKALKWGLITVNPADLAEAPTNKKKEMKVWTAEQVKTFLNYLKDDRWLAIYMTACGTGLREGELLGLSWSNVNLEEGNLKVTQSLYYIPRIGLVFSEPKSEKSRRLIMLPDFVIEALKAHKVRQDELRKSPNWKGNGLVFTTNIGTPISPRNLVRHFKQKTKEANLPDIRFHDLRHSFASILLEKNVHPKIVQEILGHSNITLTLNTYSHIIPTMQKEAMKTIDKILS